MWNGVQNVNFSLQNEIVYAGLDGSGEATGGKLTTGIHVATCKFPLSLLCGWVKYFFTVGPLCQMEESEQSFIIRSNCLDLVTYTNSLVSSSQCTSGQPGRVVWTPDDNTPDLVYYQVKMDK